MKKKLILTVSLGVITILVFIFLNSQRQNPISEDLLEHDISYYTEVLDNKANKASDLQKKIETFLKMRKYLKTPVS